MDHDCTRTCVFDIGMPNNRCRYRSGVYHNNGDMSVELVVLSFSERK